MTFTISTIGIDGSGKSTLIPLLVTFLNRRPGTHKTLTIWQIPGLQSQLLQRVRV